MAKFNLKLLHLTLIFLKNVSNFFFLLNFSSKFLNQVSNLNIDYYFNLLFINVYIRTIYKIIVKIILEKFQQTLK
jgi:hypothetical protein